jgi:putative nucleotidyltransferase with HDIG domain
MSTAPTPVITRDSVIAGSRSLPSFPSVVSEILATLDDPDGNFNVLVRAIKRDPLISARVISVANTASLRGARESEVCDIATAASLIGISRVRHITLISSLNTFVAGVARQGLPNAFWQHSVAVGICCEELAQWVDAPVSSSMALMAGLLHDIGQLWLHHANPSLAQDCRVQARERAIGVEVLETANFGVAHGTIGAWLLEYWSLPAAVVAAVGAHHSLVSTPGNPLVALLHVAEVISNALDLTGRVDNRVTTLSSAACEQLGLIWSEDSRALFGRIEARASHANAFFSTAAS